MLIRGCVKRNMITITSKPSSFGLHSSREKTATQMGPYRKTDFILFTDNESECSRGNQ